LHIMIFFFKVNIFQDSIYDNSCTEIYQYSKIDDSCLSGQILLFGPFWGFMGLVELSKYFSLIERAILHEDRW